jgi:hypothetical protein
LNSQPEKSNLLFVLKEVVKQTLIGSLGGGFLCLASSYAHCPQNNPPQYTVNVVSERMAIQTAFYPEFNITRKDTFHQAKLIEELKTRFASSRHAAIAVLENLVPRFKIDTFCYPASSHCAPGDSIFVSIDTLLEESFRIRILHQLKGDVEQDTFEFQEILPYYSPPLDPTTYSGLAGKPFVAFFDAYKPWWSWGVGPVDGCFFEPSAFMLIHGRIHRKGLEGKRMPGISLSLDRFLGAVVEVPIPGLVEADTSSRALPLGYGRIKTRRVAPP